MSTRVGCRWNLIYRMPPQLRSLFIVKEDLDQWQQLYLCSFTLSSAYQVSDPPSAVRSPSHPSVTSPPSSSLEYTGEKKRKKKDLACSPSLQHTHIWLPPLPSDPPPGGLMRRWVLSSPCSLPVLFFCIIGVLLVTINSFLSQLPAALICCHREKSNAQFHSHCVGSHASFSFFLIKVGFFYFIACCDQSKIGFWGLSRSTSYFPLKW